MSNTTYNRNVPASDATMTDRLAPWPLTKSQWALYYWLLAHSNWNSFSREDHYYIYRNAFTYPQIMKDTGIKSAQTIVSGLDKLIKVGAIQKDSAYKQAYQLLTPSLYVPMDVTVLKYLLSFNKQIDPSVLITMFAILARWLQSQKKERDDRTDKKASISFTATELGRLMGIAKSNVERAELVLALMLLAGSELITLQKEFYNNRLKQRCVRYTITEVHPEGTDFIVAAFGEEEPPDENRIREIWAAIVSQQDDEEEG